MMEAESKFRALLIRISKLLSRKNVEELVFITEKDINNRQLSEEFEESGNALKLFQAMSDRGLYTLDDPSLLLQHLKDIDRCDAVRILQQEMDTLPSQNTPVSNRLYPRLPMDLGQQEIPVLLNMTPAPIAINNQPRYNFKGDACSPGTATMPCSHGHTAGTKTLEPEASLFGDADSPRFPDIPERPQRANRDTNRSSQSYFTFPEPEKTYAVTSPRGHPDMPEQPPPGGNNRDVKSSGPERSCMGVTPAGNCLSERLPQARNGNDGSLLKAAYNLPYPVPASETISVAAVPQQTVQAARPDTTYMYVPLAQQQQQPAIGLHRPQACGMNGIIQSKIEVEPIRGRPPPVPERPPQRHSVEELELCRLSRHFNAGDVDHLGHELGFSAGRISQLMYENPRDISRVFYRLMVEWRSAQHGGSNMRENLANHLRNIQCIELAGDLEIGRFISLNHGMANKFVGLDKNHVEGFFDHQGGELSLATHGCMLRIPTGALEEGSPKQITLEVLTELPDDIKLEEDEMVVSPGFKCLPSGLHFKKPVKLIMPHCAVLSDPGKVKTVLHSWSHQNTERIPQTPATCKVHHSHFELMLEHFSKGWLTMLWDWISGNGKIMCCMPYLPNTMPESGKPLMELRLQNKSSQALTYAKGRLSQPALDEDYQITIERKDLTVTCDHAQEDNKTEILECSKLFNTDRCKVPFILDLQHKQKNTIVTLKLIQTNTQKILFDTGCMAPYAPHLGLLQETGGMVTNEILNTLSTHIPHGKYTKLSEMLGIEYNEAQGVLFKHGSDSKKAIRECFSIWKDNSGGKSADLQEILRSAELFGLWTQYIIK